MEEPNDVLEMLVTLSIYLCAALFAGTVLH